MNSDGRAMQLDLNDVSLSEAQKATIGCETTRIAG